MTTYLNQVANRVEYALSLIDISTRSPERFFIAEDDFYPGAYVQADALYYGQHTWRVTEGDSLTQGPVTIVSGKVENPGVYFASVTASDTWAMSLGETFAAGIPIGDIENVTIIAALNSSNYGGAEAFFGLATTIQSSGVGNDAVGLWYSEVVDNNNWLVRHKTGGVDDATVSSVILTNNLYVEFKLQRISVTQMTASINGTIVATLTHGVTMPAAVDLVNIGMFAAAGGGATLTTRCDFFHVRSSTPSRQG